MIRRIRDWLKAGPGPTELGSTPLGLLLGQVQRDQEDADEMPHVLMQALTLLNEAEGCFLINQPQRGMTLLSKSKKLLEWAAGQK